ncbi:FUSC family protein [Streptomyces sp. BBFR2]|uniref:FUSC family protein n=1 Tax=Streptomyces sp. BBFR2 TaxID=3372854 RepID=UPI0037D9F3C5
MTTPADARTQDTAATQGTAPAAGDRAEPAPRPRTGPLAPYRVAGPRRWWDRVLAADPGLGQLQSGWRSLVSMTASLATGYGMSVALDLPAVLAMTVAGMMGLMSAFVIAENTPLRLARASLWMPLPYSAALPLAAWLRQDRLLEIVLMVTALALTFFLARFGTLALLAGMMVFNAFMVAMLAAVPLALCGELFVVALTASAAVLAARLLLCYPMPREDLLRTQRAFVVEARRVADAATAALDPDADHEVAVARMRRSLRRLNTTTVTIDGRLAQPEVAADPVAAELLHRHLFDAELALRGIGEAITRLTRLQAPAHLREAMVVGLVIARDTPLGRADALHPAAQLIRQQAAFVLDDPQAGPADAEAAALARRVGDLLDSLADSLAHWLDLGSAPTTRADVPFRPTVALEKGQLPGTGAVARRVVAARDGHGWRRAVPYLRVPLHAAVASAIVCPLTDAIDPRRFYWGLVGVMITLFGTSTTHERLRKFVHRMAGTVAGAVLGILLLRLIGHGHVYATLTVIVLGLAAGSWGMQRRYAYWVVGLVTALTQLYGMTTPYDAMEGLLAERLLDNGLGVLAATACAALIFPVSNRRVAQEAERGYLSTVEHLLDQIALRWDNPDAPVRLRGAARAIDAALVPVEGVLRPLVRMPLGIRGRGPENRLALLTNATAHARALAAAADTDLDLAPHLGARVRRILTTLTASLHALDRHAAGDTAPGTWTRVSPLIRDLTAQLKAPDGPRADRLHTALRELAALDEALAAYAEHRGLTLTTATPAVPAPRPASAAPAAPASGPASAMTAAERRTQQALAAWAARNQAAHPRETAVADREPRAVPADAPRDGVGAATSGATSPGGATPPANPAPATAAARPRTQGATVTGALRCTDHPGGCDAWITIVNTRGKRRATSRATAGHYRIPAVPPGSYTLIASGSGHPPRAAFLSVRAGAGEVRHDIALGAVDGG